MATTPKPVARKKAERFHALITTDFARPHENGVANYVELVTQALAPTKTTILTYEQGNAPVVEKTTTSSIRRLRAFRLVGDTFRIPRSIPPIERHDIVITNTRFFTTSVIGAWLAHRWRVPHIHIEHGAVHVPHHNPLVRSLAWLYDQTIGRAIISHADLVICVSAAGVPFVKKLGAKNIEVIPNAIDERRFATTTLLRRKVREELGIASRERMVLGVGRLVREKGFAELIDAAHGAPLRLVIIGDGPERAALEMQADRLDVPVTFLGNVPSKYLPQYYAAADLFVNPSWAEGLPTTVLEALAARVPVIATNVGGTHELLPRTNLVPPKNVRALRRRFDASLPPLSLPRQFTATALSTRWRAVVRKYINH